MSLSLSLIRKFFYQWLVRKAIEARQEMGDFVQAFAASQFDRDYLSNEVNFDLGLIFRRKQIDNCFYRFRKRLVLKTSKKLI